MVDLFQLNESVLEEAYIKGAMKRFCSNLSGGPSRIQMEHLNFWLEYLWYKENPETIHCIKIVCLVQTVFHNRQLTEEAKFQAIVLMTK